MKSFRRNLPIALLLLAPQAVLACPMCKDSIPGAVGGGDPSQMSGGGGLPGGFNTSVYVMLIGFFVTLGIVAWTIVKGIRSGNRAAFPVKPSAARLAPVVDGPAPVPA